MALIDLIRPEVVKTPLSAGTMPEAISELVQVLKDADLIQEAQTACDAVMARESQGSTGLENGIAVPHAKTPAVTTLTVAIGIAPQGIDTSALDGNPSKIFFLMLAPPDQSGPHIEALAEIARIAKSQMFLDQLLSSQSSTEVAELFCEE